MYQFIMQCRAVESTQRPHWTCGSFLDLFSKISSIHLNLQHKNGPWCSTQAYDCKKLAIFPFTSQYHSCQLCVSAAMPSFLSHFLCYRSNISIIDATSPLNFIARLLLSWAQDSGTLAAWRHMPSLVCASESPRRLLFASGAIVMNLVCSAFQTLSSLWIDLSTILTHTATTAVLANWAGHCKESTHGLQLSRWVLHKAVLQ